MDEAPEKNVITYQKLLEYALWLIGQRRYSRGKLHEKLIKRGSDIVTIEAVLHRLKELAYVDDRKFAHDITENLHQRGKSKRYIALALRKRLIPEEDIHIALDELTDNPEHIILLIQHYERRRPGSITDRDKRQKLMQSLIRKGFDYTHVQEAIKLYQQSSDI